MVFCLYTTSGDIAVRIAANHLILLIMFLFASQAATMKRVCAVASQNCTDAAQPASIGCKTTDMLPTAMNNITQ